MRSKWYKQLWRACGGVLLLLAAFTSGRAQDVEIVLVDSVRAESVPSNPKPFRNDTIRVAINVDMIALQAPNNRLSAYQTTLKWNKDVIQFLDTISAPAPWNTPNLNLDDVGAGRIEWNDFVAGGTSGKINILNLRFRVTGNPGDSTILDLNFTEMTNSVLMSLLPILVTKDGKVTVQNRPPEIDHIPPQTMSEGATLNVAAAATDPDNGKIKFRAVNLPAFGALTDNNNNTATIRFTPDFDAAGVYPNLMVIASDDGIPAKSDTTTFTLTVNNVNRPPVLAAIADQTMNEGATLNVTASATDPENGKIKFLAVNLPAFGVLTDNNDNTATIRFTPDFDAAGVYPNIMVIASDDGIPAKSDTATFVLTVNNVNRPPVLAAIADQTMNEGATLNVTAAATDPDNGKIKFLAVNLPAFGVLTDNNNNTATIRFTPGFEAAGVYPNIRVIASDDGIPAKFDTTTFALTVKNVNRPPVITPLTPPGALIVLDEGKKAEFALSATDPDGDQIKLSGKNLPTFAAIVDSGNGKGRLILTPGPNDAGDYPNIMVFATDNGVPPLSDSTGLKLKVFDVLAPLMCKIEIVTPKDGEIVCANSVEVCVRTTITGAVGPVTSVSTVNGIPVLTGCVKVPLVNGPNKIVARLTVKDAQETCVSADSVTVIGRLSPFSCTLNITAPADGALICSENVDVKGIASIAGSIIPLTSKVDVNGVPATLTGNAFSAPVKLTAGSNTLIATFTVTDSCNNTAVCRDTIRVRMSIDENAPTCAFSREGKSVVGTFFDNVSGIASIEPVFLLNGKLTVEPFTPGAQKVDFRVDPINEEDSRLGFDLKATDACGNSHICDPVFLQLTAERANNPYVFQFRSIDRYLQLTNKGLSEVRVELNGKRFSFSTTRRGGSVQSLGVYAMPVEGEVALDLQTYLRDSGDNDIRIEVAGPAGSSADLLLINELHGADHALALQEVPLAYELSQNYPNPFNPETVIRFGIPAHVTAGTPVQLRIYNMLGELVRTLVDQPMQPGSYIARWNGRNGRGVQVAAGVYIYRIVAGDYRATKRMLLLK